MLGTSFYKLGFTVVLLLSLSACASTRERFPDYSNVTKTQSSIPVVVDLFVYRDIAGQNRGYNLQANSEYLDEAVTQIESSLNQLGFSLNLITKLNGLTYDIQDNANYVRSLDWKSTGNSYGGLQLDQSQNPWLLSSTKEYVSRLFEVGKKINSNSDKDQAYAEEKVIQALNQSSDQTHSMIKDMTISPLLFEGLDSDVVLFVRTQGRFQKLSKFLTNGILMGAASGVLTGLVVVPAGSYAETEIIAYDVRSRQILWHTRHYGEGRNSVKNSIKSAFSVYPDSNGESKWDKQQRKASIRQRKHF